MNKTICFTGGGTAGHVVPNVALIEQLERDVATHYIGANDMEKSIIEKVNGVTYHSISARKLARKFDLRNLLIPFSLIKSVSQARKILKSIKPDVVFNKGGYVGLPVVIAARTLKIKVVSHESDINMGLANKLAVKFSDKIYTTFETTAKQLKKAEYVGSPIKQSLYKGNKANGLKQMGLSGKRPILLVLGGSQGAKSINDCITENIATITQKYDVFVIAGRGKLLDVKPSANFNQVEYVDNLSDIYAAASMCITRSGSNTLCELVSLTIPTVTIPLVKASRGEQQLNASYFSSRGCALMLEESNLDGVNLLVKLDRLNNLKDNMKLCQQKQRLDGTKKIVEYLNTFLVEDTSHATQQAAATAATKNTLAKP